MPVKASDLFVKALEAEGVAYIFGIPGEENLDLLNSLKDSSIRLILTRHEQAAGFMAATYGRLTGKDRASASPPRPRRHELGDRRRLRAARRHAHDDDHRAEADQDQQAGAVPDHRRRRHDAAAHQVHPSDRQRQNIPVAVREAFRLAEEERPGAAHLELPEDIAARADRRAAFYQPARLAGRSPKNKAVRTAVAMIEAAQSSAAAGRRRRQSQADLQHAAAIRREHRHPLHHHPDGQGRDRRDADPLFLGNAALSDERLRARAIDAPT